MKRKLLLSTVCVATAVSMAACSGNSSTSATTAAPETTTQAPETTQATQPETTQATAEALYTAGTYSASEQGFGGPVTVTITVTDTEITDVTIEGEGETPTVGGAAFDTLKQAILDTQSAEIDAVAGATITSDAVKKAAASALAQAKGEAIASADLAFTAGTYTGTGDGYNGPVEVSVTFDEKSVTAIEVTSSKETEHVGDIAFDILIPQMIEANGTGVDGVSGATFSTRALKAAVNAAAEEAGVTNASQFAANTVEVKAQDPIEDTWDVVIVGGGGAGITAAAQAAQDGNTVLLIEKNAEIGGNTLVSGGQYQSVMPYLVWDEKDPDATTGVGFDGNTYNKVKSVNGCINELKMIYEWSEEEFDANYYKDHEYVAGDAAELSKHGVHADYLPTLQALKKEIKEIGRAHV